MRPSQSHLSTPLAAVVQDCNRCHWNRHHIHRSQLTVKGSSSQTEKQTHRHTDRCTDTQTYIRVCWFGNSTNTLMNCFLTIARYVGCILDYLPGSLARGHVRINLNHHGDWSFTDGCSCDVWVKVLIHAANDFSWRKSSIMIIKLSKEWALNNMDLGVVISVDSFIIDYSSLKSQAYFHSAVAHLQYRYRGRGKR